MPGLSWKTTEATSSSSPSASQAARTAQTAGSGPPSSWRPTSGTARATRSPRPPSAGRPGVVCHGAVGAVLSSLAWTADRGYLFQFYGLDDQSWYTDAWLDEFLAAVQLHPEDAVAP